MASHRVTVTQEPAVVRTVGDRELLDLDRQGLIHSSESGEYGTHKFPTDEPATDAAPAAPADKKKAKA